MTILADSRDLTLGALFAALMAVSALVALPMFGPVPFTLQVAVVLLAGLVLRPRLATAAMVAYLLLGLVAPVYSEARSGIGILFGPTGGYLFGFVCAALVVSVLRRTFRTRSLLGLTAIGLVGVAIIYAIGASWLAYQLHTSSLKTAVIGGALQFFPLDLLKAFLAALLARSLMASGVSLPDSSRNALLGIARDGESR